VDEKGEENAWCQRVKKIQWLRQRVFLPRKKTQGAQSRQGCRKTKKKTSSGKKRGCPGKRKNKVEEKGRRERSGHLREKGCLIAQQTLLVFEKNYSWKGGRGKKGQ